MTEPHWQDDLVKLYHGDCIEVLKTLPDNSVHAVVTDPPYGLEFMGKEWDSFTGKDTTASGSKQVDTWGSVEGKGPYSATLPRFTGKQKSSLAPFQTWCEEWGREALRVLKPGGYLLAFGGTRTYHRLTCGLEDAGFEIRDSITWLYGCHDQQTEALTDRGWVPGLELRPDDKLMEWRTDGTLQLVQPTALHRYPYDGQLVRFRNADVDQLVTPNHRVIQQRNDRSTINGVRVAAWSDWRVDEAANVNRWQRMRLPAAGVHDGPGIGGEDYAALLGWVWTEGGFDPSGTGVRIWQSETANPDRVQEIAALLDRLGPHKRYDRTRSWRGRQVTETCWYISGDLARRIRGDLPGKTPTYDLLWRMTQAEKRALWAAAMNGDGSRRQRTFWQKDRAALEWAQTLLTCIGARGKVANDPRGALHWQPSATVELQARHLRDSGEDYCGDVWCATVPSGAFVIRRNGRVSVSGNSGFPKSLDVAKAIDRQLGERTTPVGTALMNDVRGGDYAARAGRGVSEVPVYEKEAVTDEAKAWQGWGTALKPASEPIVVARKPLEGTVASSVLEHGTGALHIDACRVEFASDADRAESVEKNQHATFGTEPGGNNVYGDFSQTPTKDYDGGKGRWPANVVITHLPECEQLGAVTERPVGGGAKASGGFVQGYEAGDGFHGRPISTAAWHCADGCPARALDVQSGVSESRIGRPRGAAAGPGWGMSATGAEYADVGGASRFFPAFRYEAKAPTAERPKAGEVMHPTVKPLDLMRWLVRLVCPPGGTVLEPFAGSGTTAEACVIEGVSCIAIEREAAYLDLITARLTKPIQPDLFGLESA